MITTGGIVPSEEGHCYQGLPQAHDREAALQVPRDVPNSYDCYTPFSLPRDP